jgi:hypothetical protein
VTRWDDAKRSWAGKEERAMRRKKKAKGGGVCVHGCQDGRDKVWGWRFCESAQGVAVRHTRPRWCQKTWRDFSLSSARYGMRVISMDEQRGGWPGLSYQ